MLDLSMFVFTWINVIRALTIADNHGELVCIVISQMKKNMTCNTYTTVQFNHLGHCTGYVPTVGVGFLV